MNSEVFKIYNNKDVDENTHKRAVKLSDEVLLKYLYDMNVNMAMIYGIKDNPNASINTYISSFIQNIFIVLKMFEEMNVYPDYFFDIIFKHNIDVKRISREMKDVKNDLVGESIGIKIKGGLENGFNYINTKKRKNYLFSNRNISDCYTELLSYYQAFKMEYGNDSIEQCQKSFDNHYVAISNIMTDFSQSDYVYSDIEYMSRLLFEYLSFFAEIGINPKEYLDELIDEKQNIQKK